VWAFAW